MLVLVETVGLEHDFLACGSTGPASCVHAPSQPIRFVPVNHIGFSTESYSILADRFVSSWTSFWTGAYAAKTADCDQGQVHFELGMWLAGYWVSSYLGFSDDMVYPTRQYSVSLRPRGNGLRELMVEVGGHSLRDGPRALITLNC